MTKYLSIIESADGENLEIKDSYARDNKMDKHNPTGTGSISIGDTTSATGTNSVALGKLTVASGIYSYAQNLGTKTQAPCESVLGRYNIETPLDANGYGYLEVVGRGSSDTDRHNARVLDWDGNMALKGALNVSDIYFPHSSGFYGLTPTVTSTSTDILTIPSGFTWSGFNFSRLGTMCMMNATLTWTESVHSTGTMQIGTIRQTWNRPNNVCAFVVYRDAGNGSSRDMARLLVNPNGTISLVSQGSTSNAYASFNRAMFSICWTNAATYDSPIDTPT